MKKIFFLLMIGGLSFSAMAQKSNKAPKVVAKSPSKPAATDNPAQRVAMNENRVIGPMHRYLMEWGGHWRQEVKIWNDPSSEPTTTRFDSDGRLMGEGRFLVSTVFGQMDKQPYEAQSVLGYDNAKKVFVKTWFDNLGTSILVLEGEMDEANNQIEFRGTTMDPIAHVPINIRQVMKFKDSQNQTLEVYMEGKDGNEVKTMEIKSTR